MSDVARKKKAHKGRHSKRPITPKWKLFRAKEPFLSVFMWGINHMINELSHVVAPRLLMPGDYKAFSKVKVDNHLFNKDNMSSHFKVKEYCPNVFRSIREKFGVEDMDYLNSFTRHELQPFNSSGRSGARFFHSFDKRFVVKTICAEEVAEVHSILQDYYKYVVEKHGKTLLPQYLGMYRMTVEGTETYVIVMRNILSHVYPVHKKYDLKGSTVQRQASCKERAKELPTYKDNDFLEEKCQLYLSADYTRKLMELLTADTEFLAGLHLMDYSLLVGIYFPDRPSETNEGRSTDEADAADVEKDGDDDPDSSAPDNESSAGSNEFSQPTPPDSPVPSSGAFAPFSASFSDIDLNEDFYAVPCRPDAPERAIYFVGLVDILTYYGMKKKTAAAAKTVKYGPEAEISSVRPQQYAKRLVDFVVKAVNCDETTEAAATETTVAF